MSSAIAYKSVIFVQQISSCYYFDFEIESTVSLYEVIYHCLC